MWDIIIKCRIRDGEMVEGEIEEGGCEETFRCLKVLSNGAAGGWRVVSINQL
jgi:hypothetical protein